MRSLALVADRGVPVRDDAPHDIGAHPAEPDHSELHDSSPRVGLTAWLRQLVRLSQVRRAEDFSGLVEKVCNALERASIDGVAPCCCQTPDPATARSSLRIRVSSCTEFAVGLAETRMSVLPIMVGGELALCESAFNHWEDGS
ncbi:hypothetical protein Ntsu_75540 [Nocardia sp. IFM 10818]